MLLHMIGPTRSTWAKKIIVSDDITVFQKDYVYCEEVAIDENGILLRLHPRSDNGNVSMRVSVWSSDHTQEMNSFYRDFAPVPPDALRWRISHKFRPNLYQVRIELEDCVAFDAPLLLDKLPF
jgi:hypothetical protein